jgi:acyl-coenzyme A thioesterase PaaI-like protein
VTVTGFSSVLATKCGMPMFLHGQRLSTLHVLHLICAITHACLGFQPLDRIMSTSREQQRVRCGGDDDPTRFYASRNSKISVLYESKMLSSTSETTDTNVSSQQEHDLLGENYEPMTKPIRSELEGHAIFGTLFGESMIERYQIWKVRTDAARDPLSCHRSNENVVIGLVTFGSHLNGHSSMVHGGILSLVFDDICGFAYEAVGVEHAVTANLNVNFRAPVPAGSQVRLAVQLEAREGRKLYWKVQMTSLDQGMLYAEATSLYIIPRSVS